MTGSMNAFMNATPAAPEVANTLRVIWRLTQLPNTAMARHSTSAAAIRNWLDKLNLFRQPATDRIMFVGTGDRIWNNTPSSKKTEYHSDEMAADRSERQNSWSFLSFSECLLELIRHRSCKVGERGPLGRHDIDFNWHSRNELAVAQLVQLGRCEFDIADIVAQP